MLFCVMRINVFRFSLNVRYKRLRSWRLRFSFLRFVFWSLILIVILRSKRLSSFRKFGMVCRRELSLFLVSMVSLIFRRLSSLRL